MIFAAAQMDDLFLEILLRRFTAQDRNVSPSRSPTYAPSEFAKQPEAKKAKASAKALTDTMERLFAMNKLKVVTEGPPSRPRTKIIEMKDTPDTPQKATEIIAALGTALIEWKAAIGVGDRLTLQKVIEIAGADYRGSRLHRSPRPPLMAGPSAMCSWPAGFEGSMRWSSTASARCKAAGLTTKATPIGRWWRARNDALPTPPFQRPSNGFQRPVHTHPLIPPLRFEGTGAGWKAAPSNAEGLRGSNIAKKHSMTGLVQWHWLESRDVQERGEIAAAIGRLLQDAAKRG